jgi:periplasmic divalent cation tolerance protein
MTTIGGTMQYTHIVVYITVPSQEVGLQVANMLVENNLAACVNILPGVMSIYQWQGEIQQEDELLLIVKTKAGCFDQLATAVKRVHPYDVPEIIAAPIVSGSNEYLAWINEETL